MKCGDTLWSGDTPTFKPTIEVHTAMIEHCILRNQGGVTKTLAVGRAAIVVKPLISGQGPEIALEWVSGQDDLKLKTHHWKLYVSKIKFTILYVP